MQRLFELRAALSKAQLPIYAANAAFFLLLSLFPALALLLGLLGRLALSQTEFFSVFQQLVPRVVTPLFLEATASLGAENGHILPLSALVGLWSASRGIYSLLLGLGRISGVRLGYIPLRLLAIVYTAAFLLALLLTFGLYSLGRSAIALLDAADAPFGTAVRFVLRRRGGISFAFLTGLFLLIYRTYPPRRSSFRAVLPGSLVAAGGWVLFSWLFSIWTTRFSDYSRTYGSVAVVAMTMLWLYFCLEIVLFGAFINEQRS